MSFDHGDTRMQKRRYSYDNVEINRLRALRKSTSKVIEKRRRAGNSREESSSLMISSQDARKSSLSGIHDGMYCASSSLEFYSSSEWVPLDEDVPANNSRPSVPLSV